MAKNRARDARRVAKSIRTHDATMEAYGNASGWARINAKAMDAYNDPKGNFKDVESIFPSAKDNNRSTGTVFTPKEHNPRAKIEFKASQTNAMEPSRLGHTLGRGHVATKRMGGKAK
jgi:hypothetical protein